MGKGVIMIIKYIKRKEVEKGGYQFIEIIGEKADGSTYEKTFPSWDDNLVTQLAEFAPGEFLNLSYKNDKYKNLSNIAEASGFAAQSTKKKSSSGGGSSKSFTASGGNSRGDDTNRASAVYLAKEVVFKCLPKTTSSDEILMALFSTAEAIKAYIAEGRNVITESGLEKGLEVPEIEEN